MKNYDGTGINKTLGIEDHGDFGDCAADRKNCKKEEGDKFMNKTCATCIENDDGLCDRKGILVHDDDNCEQHKESWKDAMLRQFNKKTRY